MVPFKKKTTSPFPALIGTLHPHAPGRNKSLQHGTRLSGDGGVTGDKLNIRSVTESVKPKYCDPLAVLLQRRGSAQSNKKGKGSACLQFCFRPNGQPGRANGRQAGTVKDSAMWPEIHL